MADTHGELKTLTQQLLGDVDASAILNAAVLESFVADAERDLYTILNRGTQLLNATQAGSTVGIGTGAVTLPYATGAGVTVSGPEIARIVRVYNGNLTSPGSSGEPPELEHLSDAEFQYWWDRYSDELLVEEQQPLYWNAEMLPGVLTSTNAGKSTWRIRVTPFTDGTTVPLWLKVRLRPRTPASDNDYPDIEPEYRNFVAYLAASNLAPLAGRDETYAARLLSVLPDRLSRAVLRLRKHGMVEEVENPAV